MGRVPSGEPGEGPGRNPGAEALTPADGLRLRHGAGQRVHLPPRRRALRALRASQVSASARQGEARAGVCGDARGGSEGGRQRGLIQAPRTRRGGAVRAWISQCSPEPPPFQPQVRLRPAVLLYGQRHPAAERRLHQRQHPRPRPRLGGAPIPRAAPRARPVALALRRHELLLLLPLGARVSALHAAAPLQRLPRLPAPAHRCARQARVGGAPGPHPEARLTLAPRAAQPLSSGTLTSSPSTAPTSPSTGTASTCCWRRSSPTCGFRRAPSPS